MKRLITLFLFISITVFGQDLADQLAQKYIITDGHVDLPYRLKVSNFQLQKEYLGIPIETEKGDFDFKRAKKGGLDAPFMSIYIPSTYDVPGAQQLADSLIDMVNFIAKNKKKYFSVATSPSQVRKIVKKGRIALPMGMENGSPIGKVEDVTYFKKRGISYITLTHSKCNQLGDSSYDEERVWNGLSPLGEQVVEAMAKEGIMIDISHVSDSTYYDVLEITPVPLIASHSSLRHFTPGFERNMTDDMVKKLGENGGVIMINFGSTFVDGEVADQRNADGKVLQGILEKQGLGFRDEAAKPIIEEFRKEHPSVFADISIVADHIDRVVNLAGIDHVGFGSDFDGVGDSLPTGLKDVSDYPNLLRLLLERGYTAIDIEKVCSGNLMRVWQEVLDYAASH